MRISSNRALIVIVAAQFSCTSLWFAGNAVVSELATAFKLGNSALGHLTASVQLGFISGTLLFAILSIADRFSPSRVFMLCATAGALTNLVALLPFHNLGSLMAVRFSTGFFLAGIYPVGMKIAADYHEKGLGRALGYLVGALVLGTALPHLIKSSVEGAADGSAVGLPWQSVFVCTSALSMVGGFLLHLLVPDGPFRRKSAKLDLSASFKVFKDRKLRSAAFGYFGHMWELYTFWAFTPLLLLMYANENGHPQFNVSLLAFVVIASGGSACVAGGYLAAKTSSKKVAVAALITSGSCCLLSPLALELNPGFFLLFLIIWGMSVVADSPQFSSLVAQAAPKEITGTALTIVNCIGFAITIVSIELVTALHLQYSPRFVFLALLPGPLFGIYHMLRK